MTNILLYFCICHGSVMITGIDWSSQLALFWPLGCWTLRDTYALIQDKSLPPDLTVYTRSSVLTLHQSLQLGKVKGCTWLQIDLDHVHSVQMQYVCVTTHRLLNLRAMASHTWCLDEHGWRWGGCWPASLHHTRPLSFLLHFGLPYRKWFEFFMAAL